MTAKDVMDRIRVFGLKGIRDREAGWSPEEIQEMQVTELGMDPTELHRAAVHVAELLKESGHDFDTAVGAAFILGWKAGRG